MATPFHTSRLALWTKVNQYLAKIGTVIVNKYSLALPQKHSFLFAAKLVDQVGRVRPQGGNIYRVSHPVADVQFLFNSFLDKDSKVLKVFSESLVYAVLCLKISAF
jgi:hypothetical protein